MKFLSRKCGKDPDNFEIIWINFEIIWIIEKLEGKLPSEKIGYLKLLFWWCFYLFHFWDFFGILKIYILGFFGMDISYFGGFSIQPIWQPQLYKKIMMGLI